MVRIKFCGLSRPCDIMWANELGADYIGFVFAPSSRRYVTPEKARELRDLLNPPAKAVGVFVNEDPEKVALLAAEGIIDMAQLHGDEDEEYMESLRKLSGIPVIKAFRIETPEDLQKAHRSRADMILLDNGSGGTGQSFDWDLLRGFKRDYFLAGGLDPENVAEAIGRTGAFAVDVSSGIETEGSKDREKMRSFTQAVRNVSERKDINEQ